MRRCLGVVLLALLALAAPSAATPAAALTWQTTPQFTLSWQPFPGGTVGYRFANAPWDSARHVLGPLEILSLVVPAPPGASKPPPGYYLVETWIGAPNGADTGQNVIAVPFDDDVPLPAQPKVPPGWVDGRSPTPVTIEHPAPPFPYSGIHGYAITVSSRPESPCAARTSCTDAEIDLPLGIGDDHFDLGPLPDGVDYLTVAAVSNSGVASAPRSSVLRVDAAPPAIRFAGVPAGWVDHPVTVTAIAEDPASGTAPTGPAGPFTAIAVDGARPQQLLGGSAEATVSGEGIHAIDAWAKDRFGNAGGPSATPPAWVRIDETPPRVSFAPAQQPEDPELIEASVADALAGASPDRGRIELRPQGSHRKFEPLPTRHADGVLDARWSSDDYPPGDYEFRVTGFDAAGNPAVTGRRSDGSPMILHNPIKAPARIASGFGGRRLVWQHCHRVDGGRRCHREAVAGYEARPALWTVPYGRPLRFGGILRAAGGDPLGGQAVEIVETFAPGAGTTQRRSTATTDADGRFATRLAPGPSRRVEAFFPGTRTLTRDTGRAVTMAVRAGLRLRASTGEARIGGKPVIFAGRLLAGEAKIPRTGRPVQLEFRVPGGTWSEFRTVQTDGHGRFRYPYAFTDDDSRGIRFQFRAVSPEQADFPYRPGASRPVAVTGH